MSVNSKLKFLSHLGVLLSNCPLNKVRKVNVGGSTYYYKRRLWFGPPLILAGNGYLRFIKAKVFVLHDREWLQWEPLMYKMILNLEVVAEKPNELRYPIKFLDGKSLASILEDEEISLHHKMGALASAIESLVQMHQLHLPLPNGNTRLFSHADATARNVLCDLNSNSSYWFDFETVHDKDTTEVWRFADDLRALIYSAAEYTSVSEFKVLCESALKRYPNPNVLLELRNQILSQKENPVVYHLAQGRLQVGKRFTINQIVMEAVSKILVRCP